MNSSQRFLFYQGEDLVFGPHQRKLKDFVTNYQGPFYLYDLDFVEQRYQEMKKALGETEIYYAVKANPEPSLLKKLAQLGCGADVVSAGEIRRAMECGFGPDRIVYSGVGKTRAEIELALKVGIKQINVESLPELQRIGEMARKLQKKAAVAFRLNPDVSINTHPYIATGLRENKFGIELSQIEDVHSVVDGFQDSLEIVGVSLHLGSQMHDFEAFDLALQKLTPVYKEILKKYSSLKYFDFGGGLGIFYDRQNLEQESKLLQEYAQVVRKNLGSLGAKLQSEPGRWLVAHAGVLITQVQYIKKTPYRTFVVVDTGMNHLIRPALYEAHHEILSLVRGDQPQVVDVVGPICESADFLGKNRSLPQLKEGDFLVIQDCGAYGASMASRYNLQDLPQEISL